MRKILLVTMIGMVLVFDVFGAVKEIMSYFEEKEVDTSVTVVYVEE